jgi:hypothetical protein
MMRCTREHRRLISEGCQRLHSCRSVNSLSHVITPQHFAGIKRPRRGVNSHLLLVRCFSTRLNYTSTSPLCLHLHVKGWSSPLPYSIAYAAVPLSSWIRDSYIRPYNERLHGHKMFVAFDIGGLCTTLTGSSCIRHSFDQCCLTNVPRETVE